jgi:hypothetical protein
MTVRASWPEETDTAAMQTIDLLNSLGVPKRFAQIFPRINVAHSLVTQFGFPVHRIPNAEDPSTFWLSVFTEVCNGIGGLKPMTLIDGALEEYPEDVILLRAKQQLPHSKFRSILYFVCNGDSQDAREAIEKYWCEQAGADALQLLYQEHPSYVFGLAATSAEEAGEISRRMCDDGRRWHVYPIDRAALAAIIHTL